MGLATAIYVVGGLMILWAILNVVFMVVAFFRDDFPLDFVAPIAGWGFMGLMVMCCGGVLQSP